MTPRKHAQTQPQAMGQAAPVTEDPTTMAAVAGDRSQDTEPDHRFTLGNERTVLCWIRTALRLLAGGRGGWHQARRIQMTAPVRLILGLDPAHPRRPPGQGQPVLRNPHQPGRSLAERGNMCAHRPGIGPEAACLTAYPAGAVLACGLDNPAPRVSRPPVTDPVVACLATLEPPA